MHSYGFHETRLQKDIFISFPPASPPTWLLNNTDGLKSEDRATGWCNPKHYCISDIKLAALSFHQYHLPGECNVIYFGAASQNGTSQCIIQKDNEYVITSSGFTSDLWYLLTYNQVNTTSGEQQQMMHQIFFVYKRAKCRSSVCVCVLVCKEGLQIIHSCCQYLQSETGAGNNFSSAQ